MIVLKGLHFSYKRDVDVFSAQDFEVRSGGFYSLFGKSGCGKTTLGKIVAELLPAHAVERAVTGPVLYVSNEDVLPSWISVRKHLDSVIGGPRRAEFLEYLRAADLGERILDRYPDELSHGQRQRCNLARFLFHDPKILVLDEALSNVDQPTRWEMLRYLKNRASPEVLIYLSHELQDVILFSDAIFVLSATTPTRIVCVEGLSLRSAHEIYDHDQYDSIKNALISL